MLTIFIGLILGTEKSKDRRTPTGLGNSYWGSADSAFGTYQRVAPPESLNCTHCHPPIHGGFKEKETRNCKGIEILLGTCPSSHRSKGLLPKPEVFWNLKLSPVSFLLSSFFCCPGFQHDRPLVSSPALGFLHVLRLLGELRPVGLLLCLVSSLRGRAEVVSARLNPNDGTIDVR